MKDLAGEDGARNLRDALNDNALSNKGNANTVRTAVLDHMTRLCNNESSASSVYAYSTVSDKATVSDSDTSADTKFRCFRRVERKFEDRQYERRKRKKQSDRSEKSDKKKKKKSDKPINTDCRHYE